MERLSILMEDGNVNALRLSLIALRSCVRDILHSHHSYIGVKVRSCLTSPAQKGGGGSQPGWGSGSERGVRAFGILHLFPNTDGTSTKAVQILFVPHRKPFRCIGTINRSLLPSSTLEATCDVRHEEMVLSHLCA